MSLTPYFRAQLLFVPNQGDEISLAPDRIPRFMTALCLFGTLAKQAGMRQITFQTLNQIYRDGRHLFSLLAHLDCAVDWSREEAVDLSFPGGADEQVRFVRVARALLARKDRGPTLGELLLAHAPSSPIERIVFLKRLSRKIAGCIAEVAARDGRKRGSVRGRVQRWAMQRFDDDVIVAVLGRLARS